MSASRFTLDTNILVYSVDRLAGVRHQLAGRILELAPRRDCVLTLQAVSEFFAVASRKGLMPRADAADMARIWLNLFQTVPASPSAVAAALDSAAAGVASYWDALLLATAAEAGCVAILTGDLGSGHVHLGVKVVAPFVGDGLSPEALALLA
jgi:predicted nucleic acid-binding protein